VNLITQVGDTDCFNACLASLTGLALSVFPVLPIGTKGWEQTRAVQEILQANGWTLSLDTFHPPRVPAGYSIGTGQSPRGDWAHSVICRDGRPLFDPHPSRAFLRGPIEHYDLVVQLVGPVVRSVP
jgi:hypothetical protein